MKFPSGMVLITYDNIGKKLCGPGLKATQIN